MDAGGGSNQRRLVGHTRYVLFERKGAFLIWGTAMQRKWKCGRGKYNCACGTPYEIESFYEKHRVSPFLFA
jgi:hypothetical protein